MIGEDTLRRALRHEAARCPVGTSLRPKTVRRARFRRGLNVTATAAAGVSSVAGISVLMALSAKEPSRSDAAGGTARPGSEGVVATGTAADGDRWTLRSYSRDGETPDCHELSGGEDDGLTRSCHAPTDRTAAWLQIDSTRLTEDGRDLAGGFHGEVSEEAARVEIALSSGEEIEPELFSPEGRPYLYFVALLEPETEGTVRVWDASGGLIEERSFVLKRGLYEGPRTPAQDDVTSVSDVFVPR